eukprot:694142-Hanusia_phi.AAC.1
MLASLRIFQFRCKTVAFQVAVTRALRTSSETVQSGGYPLFSVNSVNDSAARYGTVRSDGTVTQAVP